MTPREELVIFDRYEHVDPEFGIILEPVSILTLHEYIYINICTHTHTYI